MTDQDPNLPVPLKKDREEVNIEKNLAILTEWGPAICTHANNNRQFVLRRQTLIKETFLALLTKHHGIVARAVGEIGKAMGLPTGGMCVYDYRKADPSFANRWAEILDETADVLVAEAHRRGVEGWDRPIFQGGLQVGSERVYDSALLQKALAARRPQEWSTVVKQEVTHKGSVGIQSDVFGDLANALIHASTQLALSANPPDMRNLIDITPEDRPEEKSQEDPEDRDPEAS